MALKTVKNEIELAEKIVNIRRCTKVVKGGRRFSFSVLVVVGDGKGRVGVGTGKALEIADAKTKAVQQAKKNMLRIPLKKGRTTHYDVVSKFCSGKVIIRSAVPGTGIIAGGPLRALFEVMGMGDIVAKLIGSRDPANAIKAAIRGMRSITSPRLVAEKRNKTISEVFHRSQEEQITE
jgi:small subunit ribosomal protein S5